MTIAQHIGHTGTQTLLTWTVWIRAVLSSRRLRDAMLTEHTHEHTLTLSTDSSDSRGAAARERVGGAMTRERRREMLKR